MACSRKGSHVAAKVGGVESLVLVDSGADRSIIPKSLWLTLTHGGCGLLDYQGNVSAANGGGMHILGLWQTTCQFDSLTLVVELLVADIPSCDVLLGFDFLSKYGATIDYKAHVFRLMGKTLPLLVPDDPVKPREVVIKSDTAVPARSEVIVPGRVLSPFGSDVEGMLEPSASLSDHCDVLVARVVCRVERNVVPVRVINVTDDRLMLKEGMRVGTLHTDIEVGGAMEGTKGSSRVNSVNSWSVDPLIEQLGLNKKGLADAEQQAVKELLSKHLSVFSTGETDLGRTPLARHAIDTGDAKPIKLHPRRVPLHLQGECAEQIKQMQTNGIIQPSCSPWAAPVVLVRKRDGGLRFCVDYRRLNEVTRKDAYPLPRIDDALDSLHRACWFSTLDLASGYWQLEIDPDDRPKTAFITRQGLFEFNVLSFGLCNAPSTFQRLMDVVLADLQWTTCLVYLDDIIVFGRTFSEHLSRLDEVLLKLSQANLKVKPSKCNLFSEQVQYLGHIISAQGVRADPAKVQAVKDWPVPKTQTEVRSFVGLASYYRRFIKGFAELARPLHQLTEKGRRFKWSEACQVAFEHLKAKLISAPVLAYPDPSQPFILDTDASDTGIGAVLSQVVDGVEQVIAYASRALTKQERKYATTKKELLSMVTFTKYFKHYLLGKEFILRTDHNSLRWLHNFQGLEGQLARWVEQLASFQYKIVHRPGKLHANADALSRLPAFSGRGLGLAEGKTKLLVPPAQGQTVCVVQEGGGGAKITKSCVEDALVKAQGEDPELQLLIGFKKKGLDLPGDANLQKYAPVWSQMCMKDSRLVRIPPANSDAASQIQVILPRALVSQVLSQLHNTPSGGHLGVQKLQGKIKDRFYWPGWFNDVKQWCKQCADCASRKAQGSPPCAPLQIVLASRPYERVALDILGPLPETAGGNKYILVIGDYFSKWTEAFCLANQEACTIAKVLVEEWVCRFGAPRTVHSDQGRSFESNVFQELCRLLNIHKTRTSPYHPQSDGLIERFNRTLLAMLSLFVEANQSNWDALLPYVMMAYRSSVHASTGFSPYKVLFGREMVLPVDIMLDMTVAEAFSSVTEYVTRLVETLSSVVEAVKQHQAKAAGRQKANFDLRANFQYYSDGEFVWVSDKARKRGLCPKLQRRFKGPYRVIERVTEVLYRVVPVGGVGSETVIHFNRLKPYLSPHPDLPLISEASGLSGHMPSRPDPSPRPTDEAVTEGPSQQRSLAALPGCSGGATDATVGECEQLAVGPESGEVTSASGSCLGEGGADADMGREDQSDPHALHPTSSRGGRPMAAQGARLKRDRKAPVWALDYDFNY